jgi:hypothetical protein
MAMAPDLAPGLRRDEKLQATTASDESLTASGL